MIRYHTSKLMVNWKGRAAGGVYMENVLEADAMLLTGEQSLNFFAEVFGVAEGEAKLFSATRFDSVREARWS